MDERIAIIDSGIGGLSIVNYLLQINPHIKLTYVADNYYFPYGVKDNEILIVIIERLIQYLMQLPYNKIIIACNTASMIYNKYLKDKFLGNIETIIDETVKSIPTDAKIVGVIGTKRTIESKVYEKMILSMNKKVISLMCQDLVSLCENQDLPKIRSYIHSNFKVLKESNIDTLVLGCTHFNFIEYMIRDYFSNQVYIICSGYESVKKIPIAPKNQNGKNILITTKLDIDYAKNILKSYENLKNFELMYLNI